MLHVQTQLLDDTDHAESLAASAGDDEHEYGAVFTRAWVVEMVLDLAGYVPEVDLWAMRVIEPACGGGSFLKEIVERLCRSCERSGRTVAEAADAIRACDLQPSNVEASRAVVSEVLRANGCTAGEAADLARAWVRHQDFLLASQEVASADFVVGNPPYVRLEAVSPARTQAYRRACATMGGRADVYVGFFEVGLRALKPDGALGFICADRWMRNQYGQRLRAMVTSGYAVDVAIEMHDVDAFDEAVSAYPSITVIRRARQARALVATATAEMNAASAARLVTLARAGLPAAVVQPGFSAAELPGWFPAGSSWPSGSPERLAVLAELEQRFSPLEDQATGTLVGIGVATGADGVFVTKDAEAVETERMLPLLMARDTLRGEAEWSGHYLVDPWDGDTGQLVDLATAPRLAAYLDEHGQKLRARNVAGRQPANWYRTIDRVNHSLTSQPKLLFPDIKAQIHPVLDPGRCYPHHNLYWVTSEAWDMEVLGGLLLSQVAQLFVECYAVKMRGGYLRFQAQYLRRIRVPDPNLLDPADAERLRTAFRTRDAAMATDVALHAYGLDAIPA